MKQSISCIPRSAASSGLHWEHGAFAAVAGRESSSRQQACRSLLGQPNEGVQNSRPISPSERWFRELKDSCVCIELTLETGRRDEEMNGKLLRSRSSTAAFFCSRK